jgi:hypothetical protein
MVELGLVMLKIVYIIMLCYTKYEFKPNLAKLDLSSNGLEPNCNSLPTHVLLTALAITVYPH